MVNYLPSILLEFVRDGLIEQEHSGFVVLKSLDKNALKIGNDKNYPFFLRSCAKPLQACLLVDFELIDYFKMSDEEIAICCASHAGEPCHVEIIRKFLEKIKVDESRLKCGLHKPISKSEQNKLLINKQTENVLQNNCSGKHSMMLAICKKMGWDITTYDEKEHPLQIAIKNKIYSLCELEKEYPATKDGCGVPIYSMPLENMLKGYLNLFMDDKYSQIRAAFAKNPYLIGGEDRLDTAIMSANNNLIAKVGACGLCIIVNLLEKRAIIVKILDCDMKARAICVISALQQLGWLDKQMLATDLIKSQNKTDILTLHGEKIGNAQVGFSL